MSVTGKLRRWLNKVFNVGLRKVSMQFHTALCDMTLRMVFQETMTDWKPDYVHAHDGISLPLAAKVAETTGAKLLFDSHELETHRNPPLPWLRKQQVVRLERKYLPQADAVFTVGHKIADHLEETYRIKRPVVLYNSPRRKPLPLSDRLMTWDRTDVRSELQVPRSSFLLTYTGNLTFNRGLEQAVVGLSKAADFPDFRAKYPGGIHFALVGRPVPAVVSAMERLRKKYGEAIHMHPLPPVAVHRVVDYIRTSDAAIACGIPLVLSYEFAMPNKLFESTLAGLPILASDLIEQRRFVRKNKLGLVYRADDTDDLAMKFSELALHLEQFQGRIQNNEDLIRKFSWEHQERKMLDVYKELEQD